MIIEVEIFSKEIAGYSKTTLHYLTVNQVEEIDTPCTIFEAQGLIMAFWTVASAYTRHHRHAMTRREVI